jgi:hypothetical protein
VNTRRLRARLDRLTPPALSVIGQDRHRDRRRRNDLFYRKISPSGLTRLEETEFRRLEASFQEEDRDRGRWFELGMKEFKREPLTDAEQAELVEFAKRYPPDPNDPLKPFWEACGAVVLALDRESKE